MASFILNERTVRCSLPPGIVVLDYLRGMERLTGTKEGCREGDCGACMVLLGALEAGGVRYRAVNSCLLPAGELDGRHLVTVEGLDAGGPGSGELSPVQRHLLEQGGVQCGFCTPGLVVALTGFLLEAPQWSLGEALEGVGGNICRCTGYAGIRRAAAALVRELDGTDGSATGEAGSGLQAGPHTDDAGGIGTRPAGAAAAAGRRAPAGPTVSGGAPPADPAAKVARLVEAGVLPPYFLSLAARLAALPAEPAPSEVPEAVLVAGGTDLFVQRPEQLRAARLRFLSREDALTGITAAEDRLVIAAGTTVEELRRHPLAAEALPGAADWLRLVAAAPIRHRATVGGNLVNASPIGDLTVMLLALGASLTLECGGKLRQVALADFYRGYRQTCLGAGELLRAVSIPLTCPGAFSFEKVSRREFLDIAGVNSAAWFAVEDGVIREARISAGGVAPVPLLLHRASSFLAGRAVDSGTVRRVMELAAGEISPISDVRGSARYRRLLLRRLLAAHFERCFAGRFEVEEVL